jgi:hypothetical protein
VASALHYSITPLLRLAFASRQSFDECRLTQESVSRVHLGYTPRMKCRRKGTPRSRGRDGDIATRCRINPAFRGYIQDAHASVRSPQSGVFTPTRWFGRFGPCPAFCALNTPAGFTTSRIRVTAASRSRAESVVTLKWIAAELRMGTWTHVANRLHKTKGQQ